MWLVIDFLSEASSRQGKVVYHPRPRRNAPPAIAYPRGGTAQGVSDVDLDFWALHSG